MFFKILHEYLFKYRNTTGKTGPGHNQEAAKQCKKGKKTMEIRLRCYDRGLALENLGLQADTCVYVESPENHSLLVIKIAEVA